MNKKTKAIILISTAIVIISITAIIIFLTSANDNDKADLASVDPEAAMFQTGDNAGAGAKTAEEAAQIFAETLQNGDIDKLVTILAPPLAEYVQDNKYVKQQLKEEFERMSSVKVIGKSKDANKSEIEEFEKELDEECSKFRDSYDYIEITSAVTIDFEFTANDHVDIDGMGFFESNGKWYAAYIGGLEIDSPVSNGG